MIQGPANAVTRASPAVELRDVPAAAERATSWFPRDRHCGNRAVRFFVIGLTVAMFAPLLRSGTVWFLDAPASLLGPHPRVSSATWGTAPWVVVRAPFEHVLAALYRAVPFGQVRLLPLLAFPALATLGFHRLFRGDPTKTIAASFLFVINPFIYERMAAGQEYFLLGVAALPSIAALVVRARSGVRAGVIAGLVLTAAVVLSPHLAFMGGVLLLGLFVGGLLARERTSAIAAGVALASCGLLMLPLALAASSARSPGLSDLSAFRTAADPAFGVVPNVLGLYGFWRQGWPLAKDVIAAWPLFVASIVAVGVVGARAMHRSGERVLLGGVLVTGVLGLVLALGDQGPTGPAFVWLYRVVPGFGVMREPQKFAALLAFGYAVTFGAGAAELLNRAGSPRARRALVLVLFAVPAIASFRSLWGLGGSVAPSHTPDSWAAADRAMGSGEGAVLVLPWHRYLSFGFTQDRVVASPFLSTFDRPVVVSDDPEVDAMASAPNDTAAVVGSMLASGPTTDRFGELLQPLGIRYVVLSKAQDWRLFAWLYSQKDLRVVAEWADLVLFEILAAGEPVTGSGD